MDNKNSIFRKSSLERISSPDQLNDYIKVESPSVWLILTAIIVLLFGVCFWGIFGTLTTICETSAVVKDGLVTCYVTPEQVVTIAEGMELRLDKMSGTVTSVAEEPVLVTEDFDSYALHLGEQKIGDWVVPVTAQTLADNGTYKAEIITETISPISFLLN